MNAGTIVNVGAIILGFVCSMAAFYALTNWRLSSQEFGLSQERQAREATQRDFAVKFDSMNSSLADLKTTSAVQAETLKTISTQLGAYLQQHK